MVYKLSVRAAKDLIGIHEYGIRHFGVIQADQYHNGLEDTFITLADHPMMARERSEFRRPFRLHPYGSHEIAYRVRGRDVLIVRVLHAQQDWLKEL